jgi:hypothetical protein
MSGACDENQITSRELVMREPSANPGNRYEALWFTRTARTVLTRWRSVFMVTGALLIALGVLGVMPIAVAVVSGMLVLALSAPSAMPSTPTTAMVRTWEWLYKDQADHL